MSTKPDQFSDFLPGSRGIGGSPGWRVRQGDHGDGPRPQGPQVESGQCCVYNQTSERFLSVDAEAGDFPAQGLETRLQTLSPTGGAALWLVPFRGISPTSVRMPIDLVYLDRENIVIEAVESFPIFRVSGSSRPAASVLVLPPQTISSTGTRPGDQLILKPPAEMKLILEQLARIKANNQQGRAFAPAPSPAPTPGVGQSSGQVLPWKGPSRPEPMTAVPDPPIAAQRPVAPLKFASTTTPEQVPPPVEQPVPQNQESPLKKKKNWLERFLSPEPEDKRGALREAVPGLTAFFFTGGAPVPHGIRDVSETGLFVLTEERWYPGTVIRMTLTDQRQPTAERSFTVNAMVMRWGNDGVGLHFIFQDKKDRRRGILSPEERTMGIADAASFKEFLKTLRAAR